MIKAKPFLAILLLSLPSWASSGEQFLISELYSHGREQGRDLHQQWIEVSNISGTAIMVNSVNLKVLSGGEIVYSNDAVIPEPLLFETSLLLAPELNLGLPSCLKQASRPLLIAPFFLKKGQEHRICLTLNHELSACVWMASNVRFLAGVSLFRELDDRGERPLWKNEPCHLMDGIFATPGLGPKACRHQPNFKDEIFEICDTKNRCLPQKISPDEALWSLKKPLLTFDEDEERLYVGLEGGDKKSYFFTPCAAALGSQKICHQWSKKQLGGRDKNEFLWADLNEHRMGEELSVILSDPAGQRQKIPLKRKGLKKSALPIALLEQQGKVRLTLLVPPSMLPLNIQLISADGEIIVQRVVLRKDAHVMDFALDIGRLASLRYQGPLGSGEISWANIVPDKS